MSTSEQLQSKDIFRSSDALRQQRFPRAS